MTAAGRAPPRARAPVRPRMRRRGGARVDGRARVRYLSGVRLPLCQCNTVFEHEVVACVRRGARSVEEVGERCDAGTGCGSCRGAIKTILEEEAQRRAAGDALPEALLELPLFAGLRKD